MYNGQIINRLLEDRRIKKKELMEYIGGKGGASVDSIIKGNPTANRLERVADFFNIPIDYLFERSSKTNHTYVGHQVSGNGHKVSGDILLTACKKEVEHLKELLLEKEKLIEAKDKTIDILLNQRDIDVSPGR